MKKIDEEAEAKRRAGKVGVLGVWHHAYSPDVMSDTDEVF